MNSLTHIMTRLIHQPLLCDPAYVEVVLSVLSDRIGIEPIVAADVTQRYVRPSKSAYIDKGNGIAVVPLVGGLVHRSEYMNPASGMTGYTAVHNTLSALIDDPTVRAILLDVDSPGGEVAGLQELASFIKEASGEKPIYAVANALMASAAYWIGSHTTRLYAVPHANVGSIGVVTAHIDRSKELEKKGQAVTLIHAGKNKVAGNPYEPLPDNVRASIQSRVDGLYGDFVAAVAEARGIDEKKVRSTEADVFEAKTALEIGLVDGVGTFGAVLRAVGELTRPTFKGYSAGATMSNNALFSESDLTRARSEGHAEGLAAGRAEGERNASHAIETARQQMTTDFAASVATLFPDNPRAAAFVEALKDGATLSLSTKLASRVGVPAAAAPQSRTEADVDRFMSQHAPNVSASGNAPEAGSREARLAEIKGSASAFKASRRYA